MKKILLILLFVSTTSAIAQVVYKLDSIHQFSWDLGLNDWRHNTRELLSYDNGGAKETNLLRLTLNGSNWENFYQFNKAYNTENNITQEIQETWTGSDWQNASRRQYTYNADNLLGTEDYAIFSGTSWLVFDQHTYDYDVLNNRTGDLYQEINFATMMLENSERWTYSFTETQKIQDIRETWFGLWENDERKDYIYDSNDLLIRLEERTWTVSDLWSDPYKQALFNYNNDDLISEVIEQVFGSGNWINTNRVLNTYSDFNLISIVSQEWNSGTDAWDNNTRILQSFSAEDNLTEQILENWDMPLNDWQGFLRVLNFWSPAETLSVNFETIIGDVSLYPNPSNNFLNIVFKQPTRQILTATLLDTSGKEIKKMYVDKGELSFKIPVIEESKGVYLLRLEGQSTKKIFKIIKS